KSLSQRIPAPDPAKYANISDGIDWLNPYVVVHANQAEIISHQVPRERISIPVGEVLSELKSLPNSAWPYGRVVALSESGPQVGDIAKIRSNLIYLKQELERNGVTVDLWP
ncbi:MAG: hypothetical protein ABI383_03570, partial [Acidobacteriaceae bacterium]